MFLINFYLFIFFLQYVPKYESENVITECDTNVDAFQPQNDEEIKLVTMLDEAEEVDLKEIADILGIMYQNDCSAEKLKTFPIGTGHVHRIILCHCFMPFIGFIYILSRLE